MSTDTTLDTPDDNDIDTGTPSRRHWLTNDGLAYFTHLVYATGFIGAGMGYLNLQAIPETYLLAYIAFTGTATVWAFGTDAIAAWRGDNG